MCLIFLHENRNFSLPGLWNGCNPGSIRFVSYFVGKNEWYAEIGASSAWTINCFTTWVMVSDSYCAGFHVALAWDFRSRDDSLQFVQETGKHQESMCITDLSSPWDSKGRKMWLIEWDWGILGESESMMLDDKVQGARKQELRYQQPRMNMKGTPPMTSYSPITPAPALLALDFYIFFHT